MKSNRVRCMDRKEVFLFSGGEVRLITSEALAGSTKWLAVNSRCREVVHFTLG